MMKAERAPARNISVDALRAVSILLVLVLHTLPYLRIPGLMRANAGYHGVTLFFVVSGFLITSGALRRYGSALTIPLADFYRFRTARILPGLVLFTLVTSILSLSTVAGFELVKTGPTALAELLFYVFSFQANVYALRGALPNAWFVLWSLAIEEMFYLLFPIVCFAIPSRRGLIALLCALIVFGPVARFWLYPNGIYAYFGCFDQLAMGCLAAMIVSASEPGHNAARASRIAGAVACLLTYFFAEPTDVIGPTAMAVGGALFLAGSKADLPTSAITRFLTLPGRWSYEIYLFHVPILKLLYAGNMYRYFVNGFGMEITFALTLTMIIAIAGAIATWLLARFSRRIRGRSSRAGDRRRLPDQESPPPLGIAGCATSPQPVRR